ncbi:MAG: hypothetical protein HY000_11205 [Planctomycetes bacterium]|nr:hypothetical protein [Planctomycetota bacterium]
MRAKRDAQQTVRTLRAQGLSYREILQRVPVAKSSVSLWCRSVELDDAKRQVLRQRWLDAAQNGLAKVARLRAAGQLTRLPPSVDPRELEEIKRLYVDERLSFGEVAVRMGVRRWRVYRLMRQHGIPRRRGSEQNYATYKHKPQFFPKQALTVEEERLRVAGTMLYLAEGAKRRGVVDFTNSDPRLIAVFLAFLRRICGISEARLRAALYAYPDQDIQHLHEFWSEHTGIPLSQFNKPYVRPLTPNVSHRKMSVGLLHIRYSDRRLLELILRWGKEICESLGRYLSG